MAPQSDNGGFRSGDAIIRIAHEPVDEAFEGGQRFLDAKDRYGIEASHPLERTATLIGCHPAVCQGDQRTGRHQGVKLRRLAGSPDILGR